MHRHKLPTTKKCNSNKVKPAPSFKTVCLYIQKHRPSTSYQANNHMSIEKPHLHDPMPKMQKHSKCSSRIHWTDKTMQYTNQKAQTSNLFTDIELIPLELINSKRESLCRARESFYIEKAKTMHPQGRRSVFWSGVLVGGSGGILPQKILKSRVSEIVFTAFSARYFLK